MVPVGEADDRTDGHTAGSIIRRLFYITGRNAYRSCLIADGVVQKGSDLLPGSGLQKQGMVTFSEYFSDIHRIYSSFLKDTARRRSAAPWEMISESDRPSPYLDLTKGLPLAAGAAAWPTTRTRARMVTM